MVLAKELTKTFEHFISGTPDTIKEWLASDTARCKGEFVLIIPPRQHRIETDDKERILTVLLAELPLKQAVALACKLTQGHKNVLYDLALQLKNNS